MRAHLMVPCGLIFERETFIPLDATDLLAVCVNSSGTPSVSPGSTSDRRIPRRTARHTLGSTLAGTSSLSITLEGVLQPVALEPPRLALRVPTVSVLKSRLTMDKVARENPCAG